MMMRANIQDGCPLVELFEASAVCFKVGFSFLVVESGFWNERRYPLALHTTVCPRRSAYLACCCYE